MNFVKGIIAVICLVIFISISSDLSTLNQLDQTGLLILALSGLVGISLGDTFYFATLIRMGPKNTLLIGTLIPVSVAIISVVFLGERMALLSWVGVTLTISGVAFVLWGQTPADNKSHSITSGSLFAIAFVLANALGIILTKFGVTNIPTLEATLAREFAAVLSLAVWGIAMRSMLQWVEPLKNKQLLGWIIVAAIFGTFLGTWLSVVALKYTHTSVAATLNSTSPIFILPLVAFFLKEHVSLKAITGALIAVSGIGIYFYTIS